MKILVLGSGLMGYAAAFDLAKSSGVEIVTLADKDADGPTRAKDRIAAALGASAAERVRTAVTILPGDPSLPALLAAHDAVLSAVPYFLNPAIARLAVEAGTHFCDLGGNNDAVEAALALHDEAARRGVTVIPDCGLAPGMANVVAAHAIELLGAGPVERIAIRVGGLPQIPKPPLDYQLFFSVEGLINEYIEPCRVVRDHRIVTVPGMSEVESLAFPAPFGTLEAFQTSGGTSTMPRTFKDRVRHLDYKTIRYPGHAARIQLLVDLGLLSSEAVTLEDGRSVRPRDVLGRLLNLRLPTGSDDVVLVRVEGEATRAGKTRTVSAQLVTRPDEWRRTAMMRTTSDPTSIIAQMMVRGETRGPGAGTPETMVPPKPFLAELAARGIVFEETIDGGRIEASWAGPS